MKHSIRQFTAFMVWLGASTISSAAQGVATVPLARPDASAVMSTLITAHITRQPLEAAVKRIAQRANARLVYTTDTFDDRTVTVELDDVPLKTALDRVLRGTGLRAELLSSDLIRIRRDGEAAVMAVQGSVTGTVVDSKTQQPLRGVTITMSGTSITTSTNEQGAFRIVSVTPGSRTLTFRCLGYVKATRSVTVNEGQTATMTVALESSVNALDQVIVTGTIVATAQREVPNAMTVITAKELEERGITRIDQLFRGDVPGLFARNTQSDNTVDAVVMYSRGATALSASSLGTTFSTNPIKTYVDGVELANASYLSQIDPSSIERIEILTGPQASTIYGSNAINGVMQIFTKRGSAGPRPHVTLSLQSGWVENNSRSTRTPQHDDQLQIQGTEGQWSYNTGGSWNYMGPWTPSKQTSRLSGYGGVRMQRGPVTADASLRLATTRNEQRGEMIQGTSTYQESGWYPPSPFSGLSAPQTQTLQGQTLGLTLGYTPFSWWSHDLMVGQDRATFETRYRAAAWTQPSDTLLTFTQGVVTRGSWRYSTTAQGHLAPFAKAVVTVGGDGWQTLSNSLLAQTAVLTGTLNGTTRVTRTPSHNAGGFLQAQLGIAEQLFLTYGVRAEWNPGFGEDASPNLAPRYGFSFTRDLSTPLGLLTTKLRASYGRATRPPDPAFTRALRYSESGQQNYIPEYGDSLRYLGNPELGPEFQQGGEGGVELYFGSRGSLVITRYNQTVDGLIANPLVDSVRSSGLDPLWGERWDAEGYGWAWQYQYLNIGSIRNQGWEAQGSLNLGPFTTTGTYSWTKSRVIGITPRYRAVLTGAQYEPGASFQFLPEHTWALGVQYAIAQTSVQLNVTGVGQLRSAGNAFYYERIFSGVRLTTDRVRMLQTPWNNMNAGYALADINVLHRFSPKLEGILQVHNLADHYQSDFQASYTTLGRQSKIGLRMRY